MKSLIFISIILCSVNLFGQTVIYNQNGTATKEVGGVSFKTDSAVRIEQGKRPHLDMMADISTSLQATPAWTNENYCSTGIPTVFLRHDQDDQFFIKLQYNHNKALNFQVDDVHIHGIPMSNGAGNIRFAVYWKWINYSQVLPIDTAVAAGTWTRTFVNIPLLAADQYKETVYNLLTNITAIANETPSSILHIIVIRLGATSTLDTYTTNKTCGGTGSANFAISFVDSHYEVAKLGSKGEITD